MFQAGWFVESLWSQTLIIHMIRTPKIPFIQSRAAWQLTALTSLGIAAGTVLPFTRLATPWIWLLCRRNTLPGSGPRFWPTCC